jgi:hypothetical protein
MARTNRRLDALVEAVQPQPPRRITKLAPGRPQESVAWLQAESRRMARWRRARGSLQARKRWYALLRACLALSRDGLPQYAEMFARARRMNTVRGLPTALDWLERTYASALLEPPYNLQLDTEHARTVRFP